MSSVPVKPILMCFICKLSFSSAKSFLVHCTTEHSLALTEREQEIFCSPAPASAILQVVGSDRAPLISVLEPVAEDSGGDTPSNPMCPPHSLGPSTRERPPQREEELAGGGDREEGAPPPQQPPFPAFLPLSPSSPLLKTLRGLPGLGPAASLLSVMSGPGAAQLSPAAGSAPSSSTPTNASQLQGTTIGPCPEHVTGRQPGVECAKCDFILNSARLGEDFLNNPAKALKCPKCNWHYKYQETLEVHMKDKHPESTSHCIYCITGQQHPRLARGETYTCGYKPYRCEVCNYSTTTKGNLSIHMQSDKHINNMQELQSGGVVTASDGTKITQNILAKMPLVSQRLTASQPCTQQPSFWRCDICNFETSQPRNLRIHMTSEKHIQNITAIQHNMKQLQGLQLLQSLSAAERGPGSLAPPPAPPELLALAEQQSLPQSMLLQLLATRHAPAPAPGQVLEQLLLQGGEGAEGGAELCDPNPSRLYNCCICREFSTDSLDALASHIAVDRSTEGEGEVAVTLAGTHICKLCTYKTNLKANFQLHCKTDKHLARLSLYNHIREGGPANEWKLGHVAGTNPTQLRCHACDYNTNSLHKLQAHVHTQNHEVSAVLWRHLAAAESRCGGGAAELQYSCTLCRYSARGKAALLHHARSLGHLRAEQLAGEQQQPGIADIFTVTEHADPEQAESSETGEWIQL